MARCKLTNMNLRNIRKTREYQCLIIDLVNSGVMGKSAAEELLGYTIPAGLLTTGGSTPTDPDEDEPGEGGEGGGTVDPQPIAQRNVTIIYYPDQELHSLNTDYQSFEYDLNDGNSAADIIAAAQTEFNDDDLAVFEAVTLEPVTDKDGDIVGYNLEPVLSSAIEPGMTLIIHYELPVNEDPGKE